MFATYEESRDTGKPVSLYEFSYKDGDDDATLRYTDADVEVVYSTKTYFPRPINRGPITQSGSLDKATLEITVPTISEIANRYVSGVPSSVVLVSIRQGHLSDSDHAFPVAWFGRVSVVIRDYDVTTLQCEPFHTSIRRVGLRRNYQSACPHAFTGPACGYPTVLARRAAYAETVSGRVVNLTATGGWNGSLPIDAYPGGMIEYSWSLGTEFIPVVSSGEYGVTLHRIAPGLVSGSMIFIYPGCDKSLTRCRDVFNNVANYGGQPWIPTKNPFGSTNIYY